MSPGDIIKEMKNNALWFESDQEVKKWALFKQLGEVKHRRYSYSEAEDMTVGMLDTMEKSGLLFEESD